MRQHLVSFMGSSPHENVQYVLGDRPSESTSFMEIALSQLLSLDPAQDAITVFVTSNGNVQGNWHNLRTALEQREWTLGHNLFKCDFEPPKTERELRRALVTIADHAFRGDPERLSLDITHGFRAFAALGIKALELELADRARAGRKAIPTHFYYGALEEVGDLEAHAVPIWDLSEMSQAAEWSAALSEFEQRGRADRLRKLSSRRERPQQDEPPYVQYLHEIGGALQALADALCFLRRDVYARSAEKVRSLLAHEERRASLDAQFPGIVASLNRVRELSSALAHPDLLVPAGLRSLCELLDFYKRVERFAEAYVVLDESIGLIFDPAAGRELRLGGTPEDEILENLHERVKQAAVGFRKAKRQKEAVAGSATGEARDEEPAPAGGTAAYRAANVGRPADVVEHEIEVARLASEIFDARNDYLHWGVRGNPLSADSLSGKMSTFIARYRERVEVAERLFPDGAEPE